MKFAFISTMHGWPWGGSEELWSQAATQLKREGHDVQASVGYWPQLSDKITALAENGVKVETHNAGHAGTARRYWNKVSLRSQREHKWLTKFNPDLAIISQGHNAGGLDWAKACRDAAIPYAIIVQCNSELWWFDENAVGEAVAGYNAARKVFCVSRKNLDLLRLQVGEALRNAEVVRNPFNVSPDRSLSWPDQGRTWRLASVARMDPAAKGQDLLLEIFGLPEWRERPVELNFFGDGPGELALHRAAELLQLKNVRFHGHVHDIASIWERNHLLVLPSRCEGLPLALVEAMWCSRGAVVTDVGGNAELCLDNETGFVAAASSVACVADALERAWERRTDWLTIGQAARVRVESQMPRDPVAVFCEKLKASVDANPGDAHTG
jgi:glycosyltransferase involved in cell wall biosynthesis